MTPIPPSPPANGHPPDGYDRLLSDFFKNELPHPWPGPPMVAETGRRRADAGNRSRYTLAASVAVLMGLGAYLSSGMPDGKPGGNQPGLEKATSDGKDLLNNVNRKLPEHNPMGLPEMP